MPKEEPTSCDCIFCHSKCPECGADDVEISFYPGFSCHNDTEDSIVFSRTDDKIELHCSECGEWIEEDEFSPGKLDPLFNALNRSFDIPSMKVFKRKTGGIIESERF